SKVMSFNHGPEKTPCCDEGTVKESDNDGSCTDHFAAERLAVRRLDYFILPLPFLYYLVSFLDR
ncbi:MAG: hypothetical protein Q9228_000913, partial [Teloschistes exilis]